MSIADEWHSPEGPVDDSKLGDAQNVIDVIREGYIDVLNERFIQAARTAGLSEEWIEETLAAASQG